MKAGWEVKPLGEVCDIAPKKALVKTSISDSQLVSFVPMDHLGELKSEFSPKEDRALSSVYKGYTYFADGDVIVAKITPCFENGKMGVVEGMTNGVGFGSSEFVPIRGRGVTIPQYLFYYLLRDEFREAGARVMSGAVGHKRVPKDYLENLPIPIPSLEEQKRIVAVLDAAFEGLTRARTHIETNLQNARELFESFISERLKSIDAVEYSLADLMEKGWITSHLDGNHGSNYPQKAEFISEGVPYISANCIIDGEIDLSLSKYLSEERADTLVKGTAFDQDVIFAHNATVGPVAVLTTTEPRVLLGTSVTHYRCDPEQIDPYFLCFEMRSAEFVRQYEAVMGQATRNQVPITIQRSFMHRIPSMADQRLLSEIARKTEASAKKLELSYRTKLQDLDDLRQSLLQKAFAGELT